jgi:hypothetical protein
LAQRLFPTLPVSDGESVTSYVSRLARFHDAPSVIAFCTDMQLDFQKFVDGEHDAVSDLADFAGAPLDELERGALRRDGDGWTLRGERLTKPSLRRDRLRVCPACLAADMAQSRLPSDVAVHGRAVWLIAHFRACPIHRVALVEVENPGGARTHDFAAFVGPAAERIAREGLAATATLSVSPLEDYLLARLDGRGGHFPWLDALDFFASAKTCEMIGAVALHGRTPNLKTFSDMDWREAGAAGFGIACWGEPAIREFLSDLQATFPYSRSGQEGPQATFGRVYQWLAFGAVDAAFDPVRDLMRRHVCETTPVGPGDVVLGQAVERRCLHSIRSASLEIGAHPKRLRKLLAAKGLIADGHQERPDNLILFDADAAREVMDAAVGMSLKEVEAYLNAGRVQARLLAEHGFITPVVAAGAPGIGENAFARADLDAFLDRLLDGAEPTIKAVEPMVDIPMASKKACCSSAEIVRLILDRRLARVGRLAGVKGYMSVLVDHKEVAGMIQGPAINGLTARAVEKELKTSTRVVKALVATGFLPTTRHVNPVNRCPVDLVSRADLDAFRAKYATLFDLARERGVHFRAVKAELESKGVQPAPELDSATIGATFYRR